MCDRGTETVKVLGIDYSITSPALCLHEGTHRRWWVHYKAKTKTPYPELPCVRWDSSTRSGVERYVELAEWTIQVVGAVRPDIIVLEDYAFGALGRISDLAENGGILKAALFKHAAAIPLHIIAPTSMKKFATGSGRAQKEDIWASFVKVFPDYEHWPSVLFPKSKTGKIQSPLADIADSYFLADYGRRRLLQEQA